MKTKLFYFSSTGNSLKIARDIAEGLGDTEIIPIAKAINGDIDLSADNIGLVFPVYMWGLPSIVVDFIKKLKAPGEKYFFSVITYGGLAGKTLIQSSKLLKSQGIMQSAGFKVQMPDNYIPFFTVISEEKQKAMFEKAKITIHDIVEAIKKHEKREAKSTPFILGALLTNLFYKVSISNVNRFDKNFWLDDNCNKCGICRKVCPVNNIELDGGKPKWKHKCEHCLGCLHWCPVGAIQFKKGTIGKSRYHNRNVKVSDFFIMK